MAIAATPLLAHSVIAAVALTQFRAVTGVGTVPAAGGRCLGITNTSAVIGERVSVTIEGTQVGISGAAVAVDAALELDAQGRFITKTSGVAVGRALSAATGADQQIEVLLIAN